MSIKFPGGNTNSKIVKTISTDLTLQEPSVPYLALEPAYVTGLCEGEATFTYGRQRGGIRLRFAVKLHESDKTLIFALRTFFGVGRIYWAGPRQPAPLAGRTGASWQFCTTDTIELQKIAEHFDAYPLKGTKAASYQIWRKMLRLKLSNEKLNWTEMQSLALQLSAITLKGRRSTKLQYDQNG